MTSVLVIGAGIGGITTAARLAHKGFQVTVLEKCEQAGGRCGYFERDGHHFDSGSTLFLMPELYDQTFTDLDERIEEHLDLRRVDPSYHIHFGDGSTLVLTSDLDRMRAQLEAIEPGSFNGFQRYLDEGRLHYKLAQKHLVGRNFRNLFEYASLRNLVLVFQLKALRKHYDNIGNYFNDQRLKIALTFQDLYLGISPYEASAIFSLMQYTEFADGVWFPMGGMYSVIEALKKIAENRGVKFMFNSPVEKINIEGRKATGATLVDGQQLRANVVIANADLAYVYRSLLPDDGTTERLNRMRYGFSALVFYWGVDKQYPQLNPHNLFLSGNFRKSFDSIFEGRALPDDPNLYVHAPVRIDPSLAPDGQDTLMVALPVGNMSDAVSQDWDAVRERARSIVLQRLKEVGVADLENHIKFEVSVAPPDWKRRYNLTKGSTHGLSHTLTQLGYFRPHNRHARYKNLYFVGASTHPGTGLPTVLVSARLVEERITQEIGVGPPS